jgi:hypothetical protein
MRRSTLIIVTTLIVGVVASLGLGVRELRQCKDEPVVICRKALEDVKTNSTSSPVQVNTEEVVKSIETALKNKKVRIIFRQLSPDLFGMVVYDGDEGFIIKLNPNYPSRLVWSTFLHESLHLAYPYWDHPRVFAMEKHLLDNMSGEQVDRLMRLFPLLLFRDVAEEAHLWDALLQRRRSSQQ